jgi:hypothetical protein
MQWIKGKQDQWILSALYVLNIVSKIINDEHKGTVNTYSFRIVTLMRNVTLESRCNNNRHSKGCRRGMLVSDDLVLKLGLE